MRRSLFVCLIVAGSALAQQAQQVTESATLVDIVSRAKSTIQVRQGNKVSTLVVAKSVKILRGRAEGTFEDFGAGQTLNLTFDKETKALVAIQILPPPGAVANHWVAEGTIADLSGKSVTVLRRNGKNVEATKTPGTTVRIDGTESVWANLKKGHDVRLVYDFDTGAAIGVYCFVENDLVPGKEGPQTAPRKIRRR